MFNVRKMTNYDVIVAGAGTAGSVAAAGLAHHGLKVALYDRLPKDDIGVKICGDASSLDHFKKIESIIGVSPPKGDEILQRVKGAWLYSPDREVKLELVEKNSTGVILDRFKMGMRTLETAMDYGAELIDDTRVKEPIVEKDSVIGIRYREKDSTLKEDFAKVTIDATGINAFLRRNLDPEKTYMDRFLDPKDVCKCYRELRDTETEIESPEFIRLMFDQEICPGGYIWEFPRGPKSMNVGLGVMKINNLSPQKQFQVFMESVKGFYKDSEIIHGGGWPVPLRRPQDNLVWNGFMLIGDAGTQVKPTDGGGIGISVNAAAMATKTITKALENGDVSQNGLWDYSVEFMTTIAPVTAPLAIMKDFIVPMPSELINKVFHKRILQEDDLLYGNATGQLSGGSFTKNLGRIWRGRTMLGTLLKFRGILNRMNNARDLYENYPRSPDEFLPWRSRIKRLYGEAA